MARCAVVGRDSSKSIYREIMESLEEAITSPRVILDARVRSCRVPAAASVPVKPNREELAMTSGERSMMSRL